MKQQPKKSKEQKSTPWLLRSTGPCYISASSTLQGQRGRESKIDYSIRSWCLQATVRQWEAVRAVSSDVAMSQIARKGDWVGVLILEMLMGGQQSRYQNGA